MIKISQIKAVLAIVRADFNVSRAAQLQYTSQSALSKQLKAIEDDLGVTIFAREGRSFRGLTEVGTEIAERLRKIDDDVTSVTRFAADAAKRGPRELQVGTTQTQASYYLPSALREFHSSHPDVTVHLHNGTLEQLAHQARNDELDMVVATGAASAFPGYARIPLYRWRLRLLLPTGHRLADKECVDIGDLTDEPLVTYSFSSRPDSTLSKAFNQHGLVPNVALTVRDAETIKTYVREGIGIGVIASMAIDDNDTDLISVRDCSLFPMLTTWLGFPRARYLRNYMRAFILRLAPQIDQNLLHRLETEPAQSVTERLFADPDLPVR